jgi:cbb3-type cytochrome oxidase subunit 3
VEALLGQSAPNEGGSFGLTIFALVGMIVPLIVLGYVCWIFWRAKKRDEAESRRADEWRNAHSS